MLKLANSGGAGSTQAWAQQMLEPGTACILDCETTDLGGAIIELAIIDAATGDTLFDSLIDPGGIAIAPEAARVHGIDASDLLGAPMWPEILPDIAGITASRITLAYNAPFDQGRIIAECHRYGLNPDHLGAAEQWQCVMARRSQTLGITDHLKLAGGHRAHSDVTATHQILREIAQHGIVLADRALHLT
ncbi:3'-5' exonuclease [Rhodococcus erythropolis]|uniref:3'-5' exonuclease n=1 Tax=Rhodococcus erythropolis TaxID=1833 RepID=UPI001BEB4027|nr:3'-5' exonuclease [Rhodococcus erythropolis]MBT2269852.1 3'-5' exonuclease [Rhodococcus erythropolis]